MAEEEEIEEEGEELSPEMRRAIQIADEVIHPSQADTIMDTQQKQGVIMTLVSAILKDDKYQYRQTLRTAAFADPKQSALASGAISEAERYGAPLSPYINKIEAQNGERGTHGVRGQALEALTHYNLNMNYQRNNQKKAHDKSKPL